MKDGLKRIVAVLCAVAMIAGGCFVDGSETTKASDTTGQKEWVVASQVGDITSTSGHAGEIYRRMSDLNISLNQDKTEDDYMLYMKVYLQGEKAVTNMQKVFVELANTTNENGEIYWKLDNQDLGVTLKTGVNEIYLPFESGVDHNTDAEGNVNSELDVTKTINHFRIYSSGVTDCTGVILDEVKILDISPVVQAYTSAKAKVAPTDNIPKGYVFAGWYTDPACTPESFLSGETEGTAYAKFVREEVLSVKTQYVTRDVQTEWSLFSGEKDITTAPLSGKVYYENASYNFQLDASRDYYVLYVKVNLTDENAVTSMQGAIIEITNHGCDNGEISWSLADKTLQTGVNELYFAFSSAVDTSKSTNPTFDIEKAITHFRIYNVTKTDCSGVVLKEAKILKSVPEVLITNCDTTDGLTLSKGSVTNDIGRYKEGSGAYIHSVAEQVITNFTLGTPLNLTQYKDGSLYFDFYVNDWNKIYKNLIVEFGNDITNRYRWVVPKAYLSSGWNEICLSLKNTPLGTLNITQMDMFRVYQNGLDSGASYTAMTTIVDNIRVDRAQAGLVIANCDSSYGLTLGKGSVTNDIGRYKEGSGAYVHSVAEQVITNFTLGTPLDLTQYKDGNLYFDFYIDNWNNIYKNLIVEFGNDTTNRYRWVVPKAYLSSGWNEICLSLTNTPLGTLNITQMDMFRVYQQGLASGTSDSYTAMTTIVDNVRVKSTQDGKMFSSCDSVDGVTLSTGVLTTDNEQGRYKEGSRAYVLADNNANVRVNFTLNTSVDLSEHLDGSVYADVYVNDWNAINGNLIVEIGHNPNNTYYWVIPKAYLSSGWNQLCLAFEHATKLGTVDAKTVNTFRIRQNSSGAFTKMTTIVDNIRVEKPHSNEALIENYADIRFVTTVDSINYANVGFEIEIGDKKITKSSNLVYGTLYGVSGDTTYTYSPTLFAAESEYFKAHTVTNIPDTVFDTTITVIPFWTTQDGTKVSGTKRECTINGEIEANENATPETDLRVVMSSDLHYTDLVACYGTDKDARMAHWVKCIEEEHAKDSIDLLIINGDLSLDYWSSSSLDGLIENITDSENDMTQTFITNYLTPLLNETGIEVFVMPGNHELYTNDTWKTITKNDRQGYKVVDNNLFICVDNYRTGLDDANTNSDGTYTATDVNTIKTIMDANPSIDVYLISHYFDTAEDDTKDSNGRDLDTDLQALLTGEYGARIKGLFGGHSHEANIRQLDATWGNKAIAQTGHFSYYFEAANNKPFWGFRELIITPDDSFSQYISVAGIEGDNSSTASYKRTTTDSVWFK